MKFTIKGVAQGVNILANDHYVAIPYDCSNLGALATDGVIKEGTIIPANDATAIGVLLNPVVLAENPNGTVVIHGFIQQNKLHTAPATAAVTALAGNGVYFLNADATPLTAKFTVTYNANGGTGSVTDSSSPYTYGAEVTVKASTGLTAPNSKTFNGWALTPDAAAKDDAYDPNDKFNITNNVTLYAVWG